MKALAISEVNIHDKYLFIICEVDIKQTFGLKGSHIINLAKNIYGKHIVYGKGCYASKSTLAMETGISDRQVFNLLSELRNKDIVKGSGNYLFISSNFLRYLGQKKTQMYWLRVWAKHNQALLKTMWIRCGKSVDKMWIKVYHQEPYFRPMHKILHTNNSLLSNKRINNNDTETVSNRFFYGIGEEKWNTMSITERKIHAVKFCQGKQSIEFVQETVGATC